MKSKELIQLLQKADPTGEIEVFVDNIDIFTVHQEEMYWNGKPQLLIRDPSKRPYFDVVGGKICYIGKKVTIKTLSIEDLLFEKANMPDITVDLSEVPEYSKADWERQIAAWRKGEET